MATISLFRSRGCDNQECWFADRADLEAAIRDANPKASDAELDEFFEQIEEFTPGKKDLDAWLHYISL